MSSLTNRNDKAKFTAMLTELVCEKKCSLKKALEIICKNKSKKNKRISLAAENIIKALLDGFRLYVLQNDAGVSKNLLIF